MKSNLNSEVSKVKHASKKLHVVTHPLRIQIIELLLEHEKLNVTHIYQKLKLIQAETSLHLGLLREFGIVKKERVGKTSIYSVNTDALNYILKVSDELHKM